MPAPLRPGLLASVLIFTVPTFGQQEPTPPTPTAASIMARVAANQDTSQAERLRYVYLQHARVISTKGGTIRCEEITDSRITPAQKNSSQHLLSLSGRVLRKGKYVTYNHLPSTKSHGSSETSDQRDDVEINLDGPAEADRAIVESLRESLTNDDSRDGIAADLFPLTSKSQGGEQFRLIGRETMNGRDTFHIAFSPKHKSDYGWKGDTWIDTAAFQPVVVRTTMARNVPFAVRTFLGTSLPGLGFTVTYAPEPGGVWFPTTFGTEFKIRVIFFFTRQVVMNAENSDFARTHVSSRIVPDSISGPLAQPEPQPN